MNIVRRILKKTFNQEDLCSQKLDFYVGHTVVEKFAKLKYNIKEKAFLEKAVILCHQSLIMFCGDKWICWSQVLASIGFNTKLDNYLEVLYRFQQISAITRKNLPLPRNRLAKIRLKCLRFRDLVSNVISLVTFCQWYIFLDMEQAVPKYLYFRLENLFS